MDGGSDRTAGGGRDAIESFSHWVIRWRVLILAATVVLTGIAAYGARHIGFSNDFRVYFSDENPQLQAFEALQNTYTKTDNLLIALAPKDGRVFSRETLTAVEWLTAASWRLPYASRVDSITNFQHTQARGDDLVVGDLVSDAASLASAQIRRAEAIALSEPLLVKHLISADAAITAVNVTVELPGKDKVPEVVAAARAMVTELRARHPSVDVHIAGAVAIENEFGEQTRKDLATLTPVMYGVILLTTFLILRSVASVAAVFLVISFSILFAIGLTGWFGIDLTPPTAIAPTVVLTLAVAHGIHILIGIVYGMRQGLDRHAAIRESVRLNLYPITIATLTDVIGFLSMNFSDVPPFRDLGNIVAFGVVAAYALSMFFLPALMSMLPINVRPSATRTGVAMERLADFVVRRRTALLLGMSLAALGLVAALPRIELNDNFVKYFDRSVEFRRDSDFIDGKLAGMDVIRYSIPSRDSGGISDPDYLLQLEQFANWYRKQHNVVHVTTLADVMKRLNQNMHGDQPEWYRVPETRDLAAQYLLLYEMSVPFGRDLNNQINVDKSASLMVVIMRSSTSTEILGLEQRAQHWLTENAPPWMRAIGTGPSVMFAHIGQRNIRSMFDGNLVALLLISVVLVFALRSLKVGLLSVIPNLTPAAMAFGVWALLVGQVGLALSVVVVMTYGVVVDDTIHNMTKYVHARRKLGMTPENAVRYVFATVGTAAWGMSAILIAGFLVLGLSSFQLNSSLGLMTALIIAFALVADFFLLPPLLMTFDRRKYARTPVDRPVGTVVEPEHP